MCAYQTQSYNPRPMPPQLVNAKSFQDLRDGVKTYLGQLNTDVFNHLNQITTNANQSFQGAGASIASAPTVTVTQSIHTVTGTQTISTLQAPKGFQGGLVLASQDGFSLATGGNIRMLRSPNYLAPGAYVHMTYHPNEAAWYADTCRLMGTSGGGRLVDPTGSTLNQLLRSLGPAADPGWTTAVFPPDVAIGDLLYGSAAHTWNRLADVIAGSYLRSGGAGAAPLWSTLLLPNAAVEGDLLVANTADVIGNLADVATGQVLASGGIGALPAYTDSPSVANLTASNTVQTATLDVTTQVAQGGGLKHQRVTTGAITAASSADVTLTWTTTFTDASYTPVVSVVEATASLEVVTIKSVAADKIIVTVKNNDLVNPHTGTLTAIAAHD